MNARRLQALRNLAERPGTEAEGKLAAELLKRHEAKHPEPHGIDIMAEYARNGDVEAFPRRMRTEYPATFPCDCGMYYPLGGKCRNLDKHEAIRIEIRNRFRKGDRVYYNRWAYEKNSPGTVVGYVSLRNRSYGNLWGWINVKFDRLKNPRLVPIWSKDGCSLTHEPIP